MPAWLAAFIRHRAFQKRHLLHHGGLSAPLRNPRRADSGNSASACSSTDRFMRRDAFAAAQTTGAVHLYLPVKSRLAWRLRWSKRCMRLKAEAAVDVR